MSLRKAVVAAKTGDLVHFQEHVEHTLLGKLGAAFEARRRSIFKEDQAQGEKDFIELHQIESPADHPVAGDNQFVADYIDPDTSRAADQKDDGEDDMVDSTNEKLKKITIGGTGAKAYDPDEADLDEAADPGYVRHAERDAKAAHHHARIARKHKGDEDGMSNDYARAANVGHKMFGSKYPKGSSKKLVTEKNAIATAKLKGSHHAAAADSHKASASKVFQMPASRKAAAHKAKRHAQAAAAAGRVADGTAKQKPGKKKPAALLALRNRRNDYVQSMK